jgi:hypothetical protein
MRDSNEQILAKMIGNTFSSVIGSKGDEQMRFSDETGAGFLFYHSQDCCENVDIEDVVGDLTDLIGSPITRAEVRTKDQDDPPEDAKDHGYESATWTFYEFATVKGSVTVRWLGRSNGYYSESVSIDEIAA